MSEKKELNVEQLKNASGGSPYSPPEYDDDYDDYLKPINTTKQYDGSKRDLDRAGLNYPIDNGGKGDPGQK